MGISKLGFIVNLDGLVSVDHSINDFAETTLTRNPVSTKTKSKPKMDVHSAFIRRARTNAKKTTGNSQTVGDNCPFIYAVKGKTEGLYINFQTIRNLINPLDQILNKFVEKQALKGITYDQVMPMPSSHPIAEILATRLARKYDINVCKDTFRKSTSSDIRAMVDSNQEIPHNAKINIMAAIQQANDENKAFSLGDVKVVNRSYISPLAIHSKPPECENILLVDDLFASGSTLITAQNELLAVNSKFKIDAFCLFSPLNNRIRSN